MTESAQILIDGFERVRQALEGTLEGLPHSELIRRPGPSANTIAWLVWHLIRVQDDHVADVADVAGTSQVWDRWRTRFDLPLPDDDTGFGHGPDEVDAVRPATTQLLLDYHAEVHQETVIFLRGLADSDLQRVVDRSWDPPVTLAARLVSVLSDDLQHAGQAAYVRGLLAGTVHTDPMGVG